VTVPSKIITRLRRAEALIDAAGKSPRKTKTRSLLHAARRSLLRAGKISVMATHGKKRLLSASCAFEIEEAVKRAISELIS
jgi:hypothetical protein